MGLDDLARRSGLPRSTLHTYLSGQTLPTVSALDRIAAALDCSGAERAELARAWERITEDFVVARGGEPPRVPLLRVLDAEPIGIPPSELARNDDLRLVAAHQITRMGIGRRRRWVDIQETFQAKTDGVRSHLHVITPSGRVAANQLSVSSTANCRVAKVDHAGAETFAIFRLDFGRTLDAGETAAISFQVDFRDAYRGEKELAQAPSPESDQRVVWGLRESCSTLVVEVQFNEHELPTSVSEVHSATVRSPVTQSRALLLNDWGVAQLVRDRPLAGAYGISWDWP